MLHPNKFYFLGFNCRDSAIIPIDYRDLGNKINKQLGFDPPRS
jgi:hypothetical protein